MILIHIIWISCRKLGRLDVSQSVYLIVAFGVLVEYESGWNFDIRVCQQLFDSGLKKFQNIALVLNYHQKNHGGSYFGLRLSCAVEVPKSVLTELYFSVQTKPLGYAHTANTHYSVNFWTMLGQARQIGSAFGQSRPNNMCYPGRS